jgi:hypothetical protein
LLIKLNIISKIRILLGKLLNCEKIWLDNSVAINGKVINKDGAILSGNAACCNGFATGKRARAVYIFLGGQ